MIVILSDDQGYGDLSCTGNAVLKTPNLDTLQSESVRLTNFHVNPTCAPSRASLMTGHWNNRTGVWHTIMGRSLLRADEPTLGELFSNAGYATGLFGKWHLGDNYPFRPEDRGFHEVVRCAGGGIGQTPDFWDNGYFDNTFYHNGKPQRYGGYCTDVFFAEARRFISASVKSGKPFLTWIATNAPHDPFHAPDKYRKPYQNRGLQAEEEVFFAMIANLDENIGALREWLKDEGIEQNTILVFLTDNGSATGTRVFNAGMRGKKGSPYDGGHRVPFFLRWPAAGIDHGVDIASLTGAVDLYPTFADLCEIPLPKGYRADGLSLATMIRTGDSKTILGRTLITDSQRVRAPVKWKDSCVMDQRWRLINGQELYDIARDPAQATDLSKEHAEDVKRLRTVYENWWAEISPSFEKSVRIVAGDPKANPVDLTAHDWISTQGDPPWNQSLIREALSLRGRVLRGTWSLQIAREGVYRISLRRWPRESGAAISAPLTPGPSSPGLQAYRETPGRAIAAITARITISGQTLTAPVPRDASEVPFEVKLASGPADLQADFLIGSEETVGAFYAEVKRLDQ